MCERQWFGHLVAQLDSDGDSDNYIETISNIEPRIIIPGTEPYQSNPNLKFRDAQDLRKNSFMSAYDLYKIKKKKMLRRKQVIQEQKRELFQMFEELSREEKDLDRELLKYK